MIKRCKNERDNERIIVIQFDFYYHIEKRKAKILFFSYFTTLHIISHEHKNKLTNLHLIFVDSIESEKKKIFQIQRKSLLEFRNVDGSL